MTLWLQYFRNMILLEFQIFKLYLGFIFKYMKKLFFLFLLYFFVFFQVSAQVKKRLPCIDKKFSVVVHIFRDSLGNLGVNELDIKKNMDVVNKYFSKICVSFEVCEFRIIDNFLYDPSTIGRYDYWKHVQQLYNVKNRINLYYVTSIPSKTGGIGDTSGICSTDSLGIRVNKSTVKSKRALVHEMGHYFGLKHTFVDTHTTELADGSNSLTTGDGIEDTPADPFVSSDLSQMNTYINDDPKRLCEYIYNTMPYAVDAKSKYYAPLVGNIMSYYPEMCDCGFTDGQYLKMAETYMSNPKMW